MKIGIVLLPGMRTFEVSAVLEVFNGGTPEGMPCPHEIRLMAPASGRLSLEYGFEVEVESLRDADLVDVLVIPGVVNVERLLAEIDAGQHDEVIDVISRAHLRGAQVVSLCTGVFLVAASGILDHRDATTHWYSIDQLVRRRSAVRVRPSMLYTHDEHARIWTSAGVTAAIDLCLALLAFLEGQASAAESARGMVVAAVRTGGQAQFIPPRHGRHELVGNEYQRLQETVRHRLDRPWSVVEMAGVVHQTPRTFQRRFSEECGMPPSQWLLHERIATAQELLITTALSLEQIAVQVGFRTTDLMRKHFATFIGTPPSRYRETFSRQLHETEGTVTGRRAPAVVRGDMHPSRLAAASSRGGAL